MLGGLIGGVGGALIGGPAGAAIGYSIGSGYDSSQSARDTNTANKNLSREQMEFQERMSSTAYQRQRDDLEAAGLNPILGMGGGGASAPAGSMATMQNPDLPMQKGAETAISSAIALRQQEQQLDNMKAQEKLTQAQVNKTKVETNVTSGNEELSKMKNRLMKKVNEGSSTSAIDKAIKYFTPDLQKSEEAAMATAEENAKINYIKAKKRRARQKEVEAFKRKSRKRWKK